MTSHSVRSRAHIIGLGLSLVFVACGGTTTPDTTDGTDTSVLDTGFDETSPDGTAGDGTLGDGTGEGETGTDAVGVDVLTDGPTDAPSDGRVVCAAEATKAKCDDCCQKEHKEGFATLTTALLACACTDAICKTVCASTACASTPTTPDTACKACLNESVKSTAGTDAGGVAGKCSDPVSTACKADPKCVAYAACAATCPGA